MSSPTECPSGHQQIPKEGENIFDFSFNSAGNLLYGLGHFTSLSWSFKTEENTGKYKFYGFPY